MTPRRTAPGKRWRRRGLWAFAAFTASYVAYAASRFPHGGSTMGLAYGIFGLLAILVLLYFGVRKRSYRSTWGTLEGWLQSHIYVGLLSAALILFHSGFRFHDRVAVAAFAVLLVVVGSGIAGALFYTAVPRRLSEVESELTAAEIAAQLNQLAESMVRVSASRSAPFQQVCRELLEESRPVRMAGWKVMLGWHEARAAAADSGWTAHLPRVPAAEQDELRQLLVLGRQRRELLDRLIAQQRYRNLLDAWLYVHLPLSVVLVVLVAAHLLAVFYYARL